ncbi:SRPBCC family protein [Modestobacter marinus]|uniref:SRPBCC family protein n=1 Tax=Modestobacter marinus TaxID=477641 RepID=UPI001C95FA3C|nr:SRPBCC family protein [Modestobacter marinus]
MRSHEARAVIQTEPEVGGARRRATWSTWDSGVDAVEGRLAPGERIRIHTDAAPLAFPVVVSAMDPPHRLVFTGGMPLGLFRGVRTDTLTPDEAGATRFVMREEFTGPLSR